MEAFIFFKMDASIWRCYCTYIIGIDHQSMNEINKM